MEKKVNVRNIKVMMICVLVVIGMSIALVATVRTASYLCDTNDGGVKEEVQYQEE